MLWEWCRRGSRDGQIARCPVEVTITRVVPDHHSQRRGELCMRSYFWNSRTLAACRFSQELRRPEGRGFAGRDARRSGAGSECRDAFGSSVAACRDCLPPLVDLGGLTSHGTCDRGFHVPHQSRVPSCWAVPQSDDTLEVSRLQHPGVESGTTQSGHAGIDPGLGGEFPLTSEDVAGQVVAPEQAVMERQDDVDEIPGNAEWAVAEQRLLRLRQFP